VATAAPKSANVRHRAHRRRSGAPIAIEAIKRIDALFAIEREINGASPEHRLAVRTKRSQPLVAGVDALPPR
jgi:transposase